MTEKLTLREQKRLRLSLLEVEVARLRGEILQEEISERRGLTAEDKVDIETGAITRAPRSFLTWARRLILP